MKPFTLYLLHSSHTDVGYTDTQEKMKFHHVAFIREVLELIEHDRVSNGTAKAIGVWNSF